MKREAKITYGKNGQGFTTNRVTLPVPWVKELGFTKDDREAEIELEDDKIIIRKIKRD
jgi:antitoxin component of MazEF toxin-antitoxin module